MTATEEKKPVWTPQSVFDTPRYIRGPSDIFPPYEGWVNPDYIEEEKRRQDALKKGARDAE